MEPHYAKAAVPVVNMGEHPQLCVNNISNRDGLQVYVVIRLLALLNVLANMIQSGFGTSVDCHVICGVRRGEFARAD